jgi:hypothetical protein
MRFVTASQPLKEFLYKVYTLIPLATPTSSVEELGDQIYRVVYCNSDTTSNAFPMGDRTGAFRWMNPLMYDGRSRLKAGYQIKQRIYVSATPTSIAGVYKTLETAVKSPNLSPYVAQIKRSVAEAATLRQDTIVIYTTGPTGTERVLDFVREKMTSVTPLSKTTFSNTPDLRKEHFQTRTVPGASIVNGLPGFAVADQPAGTDDSFGMKLCAAAAEGYYWAFKSPVASHQKVRNSTDITAQQFACLVLGIMQANGMDVSKPWKA